MSKRDYTQRALQPSNAIEEYYLQSSNVYGQHDNIFIEQLEMASAAKAVGCEMLWESQFPTKEVREIRTVQCCLPGQKDLETYTTEKVYRVPLSPEERRDLVIEQGKEYERLRKQEKHQTTQQTPKSRPAAAKRRAAK